MRYCIHTKVFLQNRYYKTILTMCVTTLVCCNKTTTSDIHHNTCIPDGHPKHLLLSLGPELQAIHKQIPFVTCKGPVVAACQREGLFAW